MKQEREAQSENIDLVTGGVVEQERSSGGQAGWTSENRKALIPWKSMEFGTTFALGREESMFSPGVLRELVVLGRVSLPALWRSL
jgi:hypothetical protein